MNTTGQFKAERRLARENPVPEAATGSGRASGGSDSPLIGRERELRLLTELVRGYPGEKEEEMPYVKVGEENGRSIDVYLRHAGGIPPVARTASLAFAREVAPSTTKVTATAV